MFDYTKAIFYKTLADLKLFAKIWTISTLGVYIAYLIYAVVANSGNLAANVILLTLTSIYFAFYLMMIIRGSEMLVARKKVVKKIYKYSKYLINSVTLSIALYSIWVNPYDVHPFKLLITVFMVILLVVQLALEVSIIIVEKRFNMFIEAFHADIEIVTKPVNTVKNVFKKIVGQEVEPEKERSKDRVYLDKLVEQGREAEFAKKAAAKTEKSEKISSWLDNHISKLPFKRKKEEVAEIKELAPLNAPETVVIKDETE